jgi:branched-chain amino acid transport system permease protein
MPWRGLLLILVVGLVVAMLPLARGAFPFPTFYLIFLATVFFWVAQSTSWNILSGYSGYFSFGQGAFFGVGAYATAVLTSRHGWDFFATLPIAGLIAVAIALATGWIAFRLRSLRGEIFALLTLAVPFIIAPLVRVTPQIDGGQGVRIPVPSDYTRLAGGFPEFIFLVALAIAVLAVAVAFVAQHSRFGWALFAIRDAENVAEGLGVPTFRYKMAAISLTGFIAGLAGGVFAVQVGFLTPEGVFNLTVPLFVIVMSVLGGRGHWLGPALGALVVVTARDRLAAGGFEGLSLIILGLLLATLVLLAPEGLLARLRVRPRAVAVAFGAVLIGLVVYRQWGEPLDWLAASMVAGAAVAFLPVSRQRLIREELKLEADEALDAGAIGGDAAAGAPDLPPVAPVAPVAPGDWRPPVGQVVVECIDVTRSFGGLRALQGVSLTVHEGELIGLVGPNGSGKTTLVNLISGAFPPTSGEIRLAGKSTRGLAPHKIAHLGVARTYQIPRPFESMTVRDNVAVAIMFGREAQPLRAARLAAQEFLELVGLQHLAGARPAEINLHERQLLEMARALATRPQVLLLDEALAGLNPAEIDNAAEWSGGSTPRASRSCWSSTSCAWSTQLATRVIVLDQGLTLAEGEPAAVMRDPAVVGAYLGSGPMLEVRSLDVFYGDARALWEVDIDVGDGEIVSIVGPTARASRRWSTRSPGCTAGTRPDRDARRRHQPPPRPPGLPPRPGHRARGSTDLPGDVGRDNLDLGAYRSEARAVHAETLAWVHELFPRLRERAGQMAGSLSGGEQQMLAIGRALMARPKLLLLDEPSLGLAPVIVDEVFEVLTTIHGRGVSILLVEQNVQRALEISQRAYLLSEGRIATAAAHRPSSWPATWSGARYSAWPTEPHGQGPCQSVQCR